MFENLRAIRNKNGVSAEIIAKLLGLETKAAYYKKETGDVKFTLPEAKKIADYFNMPIEEIFFNSEVSQKDIIF